MKLNFKKHGEGTPLLILHGLFGSLDNWQTLGKRFGESGFEVYLIDARNHGQSPWADSMSYREMAEDIAGFCKEHTLENPVILGHSMGGKTAMEFALTYPELPEKLIVADIAPEAYPPHHDEILDALQGVDLDKVMTRSDAEEMLRKHINSSAVVQFLMKSLHRKGPDRFGWRFNLDAITHGYDDIRGGISSGQYHRPTLFIRGTGSGYIQKKHLPAIEERFPGAEVAALDAGHWLHAEKPDDFYNLVTNFIQH